MKKVNLTFAGGTGDPTGANFLFDTGKEKIMIDCGLSQGSDANAASNSLAFAYDPSQYEALFVTHAHIDHIGRIPFLVKSGFRGTIYSTPPTKDIAELMFDDAYGVMENESRKTGVEPFYNKDDIKNALALWRTADYGETVKVSDELSVILHDAGHVLGSTMYEVCYGSKKMLFTGDLGNSPSPLLRDTEYVKGINYLLMESVYGDKTHEERDQRRELLQAAIEDVTKRRSVLLIPVFSLERTQVLLSEINELVENEKVRELPVFLDSPLGIKITEVYKRNTKYFNAETKALIQGGDDPFAFPRLRFTPKREDSQGIRRVHPPKIVIAGSGMSNGGRILYHEQEYLSDPKNILLIIGYQAVGTPGRLIVDGQKKVKIHGEEVKVNAEIRQIHGYSAHRDTNGLLDFVEGVQDTVEKVFVAMGETKSSSFFAQRVRDYLGLNAVVPKKGDKIELEF